MQMVPNGQRPRRASRIASHNRIQSLDGSAGHDFKKNLKGDTMGDYLEFTASSIVAKDNQNGVIFASFLAKILSKS